MTSKLARDRYHNKIKTITAFFSFDCWAAPVNSTGEAVETVLAQQWVPPKCRLLPWLVFITLVTQRAVVKSVASRHSSELEILLLHCLNSLVWAHLSPSSFTFWTWDTIYDWRAYYRSLNPLQRKTLLVHSNHLDFQELPRKNAF